MIVEASEDRLSMIQSSGTLQLQTVNNIINIFSAILLYISKDTVLRLCHLAYAILRGTIERLQEYLKTIPPPQCATHTNIQSQQLCLDTACAENFFKPYCYQCEIGEQHSAQHLCGSLVPKLLEILDVLREGACARVGGATAAGPLQAHALRLQRALKLAEQIEAYAVKTKQQIQKELDAQQNWREQLLNVLKQLLEQNMHTAQPLERQTQFQDFLHSLQQFVSVKRSAHNHAEITLTPMHFRSSATSDGQQKQQSYTENDNYLEIITLKLAIIKEIADRADNLASDTQSRADAAGQSARQAASQQEQSVNSLFIAPQLRQSNSQQSNEQLNQLKQQLFQGLDASRQKQQQYNLFQNAPANRRLNNEGDSRENRKTIADLWNSGLRQDVESALLKELSRYGKQMPPSEQERDRLARRASETVRARWPQQRIQKFDPHLHFSTSFLKHRVRQVLDNMVIESDQRSAPGNRPTEFQGQNTPNNTQRRQAPAERNNSLFVPPKVPQFLQQQTPLATTTTTLTTTGSSPATATAPLSNSQPAAVADSATGSNRQATNTFSRISITPKLEEQDQMEDGSGQGNNHDIM